MVLPVNSEIIKQNVSGEEECGRIIMDKQNTESHSLQSVSSKLQELIH